MTGRIGSETAAAGYDRVARGLHWGSAILAAVTVGLAWGMLIAPHGSDARGWAIALHASCGIVILVLMGWWSGRRLIHRPPPLRPLLSRLEAGLARATHAVLRLLFLAMPLSGYVGLAAAGRPLRFFGLFSIPPLVPESGRLSQTAIAVHLVGQFLVYALVALHAAAALAHLLVRRDGIFERMLPRRR
ncbi:MAG: cytochrome b [Alphaproteobacteria bacterium]|nr:cytochrome b [Alphaproteobacteria bacterium]